MQLKFEDIGRLAAPDDNVAIATRILPGGAEILKDGEIMRLSCTVLEGHRFAIQTISPGDFLRSWGMPFGTALTKINPGDYVCNDAALRELANRTLDFTLPQAPNFTDDIPPFNFDSDSFVPADALTHYTATRTFKGYRREGERGVGTRNMIVLLGTTALTAGFVRTLETRLQPLLAGNPNVDGIVAVAHTEGGHENPNNRDLLLRTLAGFMIHPNVGAVLAVDYGNESITNAMLQDYIAQHDYPIDSLPHAFMSLSTTLADSMTHAEDIVRGWLDTVNNAERGDIPLSELKIALQCGGSDAFSGISGNPLVGAVAREIIRYGGMANLAETDELIGAESYTLDKVRDVGTAEKFLATVARFQERVGWHGHSAAGNPSGGNVYRGLYNIYLKSLGAATKRDPAVRLDYVIDYSEPMRDGGFYFMDSPGNDLESIAGQVASGCNMIFFVTGNGSITNFPFVPTIKVVTTSTRYEMLTNEMDVNAGQYLDGTALNDLTASTLDLLVDIASGQKSVGEKAQHAQVQIWRDWPQIDNAALQQALVKTDGKPLQTIADDFTVKFQTDLFKTERGYSGDQVGLILPTSLCSGQIAQMATNQLNERGIGRDKGISRFVTLVHTEGCGASDGEEFLNTVLGYLTHPMVRFALLLEHGCEKTHNGLMRNLLLDNNIDPARFGWASIQLDGGIQAVTQKMIRWFTEQTDVADPAQQVNAGLEAVRIALMSNGDVPDDVGRQFAALNRAVVGAGGAVTVPQHDNLLDSSAFVNGILKNSAELKPTLGYAQRALQAGFHVMATPSRQWVEATTGLGATGVDVVLAHVDTHTMPGHPMIPVVQVTSNQAMGAIMGADLDTVLRDDPVKWLDQLLDLLKHALTPGDSRTSDRIANVAFQVTRGELGVSL